MRPMMTPILASAAGLLVGLAVRFAAPWLLGLSGPRWRFRWPWPELLGAGLFAAVAGVYGISRPALAWYVFASLLLAIVACDVLAKLIPDLLTLGGAVAGLALSTVFPANILALLEQGELILVLRLPWEDPRPIGAVAALWGAVFGFALLELVRRLVSRWAGIEVMGAGDPKMLLMIGAFLGPVGVAVALFLSFFAGAALGALHSAIARQPHVPFGPALAVGGFVTALWGEPTLETIWRWQYWLFMRLPIWALVLIYVALGALALYLLWRLKSRAAEYDAIIEEDYRRLDEE